MTKRSFKAAVAGAALAAVTLAACNQAPPPPAAPSAPTMTREQLAQEVVTLSGVTAQMEQAMNQMISGFSGDPRVAAVAREEVRLFSEETTAEAIKIYAQEFTAEELQAMQQFLTSPAGRSMTAKQPLIAEKMSQVGARLGGEMQTRLMNKLQAAGLGPQ